MREGEGPLQEAGGEVFCERRGFRQSADGSAHGNRRENRDRGPGFAT